MISIQAVMLQLTSSYICETSIPTLYLYHSEIVSAIQKYKWSIGQSDINGWTSLCKVIIYSD